MKIRVYFSAGELDRVASADDRKKLENWVRNGKVAVTFDLEKDSAQVERQDGPRS